jgi:hypothetical protein
MSAIRDDRSERQVSGPSPPSQEEQRRLVRMLNDRIAAAAVRHHFDAERVPFQCECGDPECQELAALSLDDYRGARETGASIIACRPPAGSLSGV